MNRDGASLLRLHTQTHAGFVAAHPGRRNNPPPGGVWCTTHLPDPVLWRSTAVHEAAHALLAWSVGLTVTRVTLAHHRTTTEAGGTDVTGTADAQHHTTVWLGGAHAQAAWLTAHGYTHPELRRCVLHVSASGDRQLVDGFEAQGFAIDRDQAVADAHRVLTAPAAAAALTRLADQLVTHRALDEQQITDTITRCRVSTPVPAVWKPGPRLPIVAAPHSRPCALG